jgi:hypothetical protein
MVAVGPQPLHVSCWCSSGAAVSCYQAAAGRRAGAGCDLAGTTLAGVVVLLVRGRGGVGPGTCTDSPPAVCGLVQCHQESY